MLNRYIGEKDTRDKKERIGRILENSQAMEEVLMKNEMELKRKMRLSFEEMEGRMKSIYEGIEYILIGERGIKQMEDHLKEFFIKFNEEAQAESERFNSYNAVHTENSVSKEELLDKEPASNFQQSSMPWNEY